MVIKLIAISSREYSLGTAAETERVAELELNLLARSKQPLREAAQDMHGTLPLHAPAD